MRWDEIFGALRAVNFKGGLAMESFIDMPPEFAWGLAVWRPVADSRDVVMGGSGADHFTLLQHFETGTAATTRDLISDFRQTQRDKIDLAAVDAFQVSGSLPNDDLICIGTRAFTDLAGKTGDYTLVSGDVQGDGTADFSIEIKGLITLTAKDFVL